MTLLDTPGHLAYQSKMISLLCQADALVLVVSAASTRQQIVKACKRHGRILALLCYAYCFDVRQIAICVTRMDLIGFREAEFAAIKSALLACAKFVGFHPSAIHVVPVSSGFDSGLVSSPGWNVVPPIARATPPIALAAAEPDTLSRPAAW